MDAQIRMNTRNQITIPARVRNRLGIKSGDELVLQASDSSIIITKKTNVPIPEGGWANYMRGLHTEVWEGVDAQEYVNELRRGWND